jgi:hypothetical protein
VARPYQSFREEAPNDPEQLIEQRLPRPEEGRNRRIQLVMDAERCPQAGPRIAFSQMQRCAARRGDQDGGARVFPAELGTRDLGESECRHWGCHGAMLLGFDDW